MASPEHVYTRSLAIKRPFRSLFTFSPGGGLRSLMIPSEHRHTTPTRKGETPLMPPRVASGLTPSPG